MAYLWDLVTSCCPNLFEDAPYERLRDPTGPMPSSNRPPQQPINFFERLEAMSMPMEEDISQKWASPIQQMDVRDIAERSLIVHDFESLSRGRQMREVYMKLGLLVGIPPERMQLLESRFNSIVQPDLESGDLSQRFREFLEVEGHSIYQVQKTLAPAVLHMKLRLKNFPYKDTRGGWRITITAVKGGYQVQHRRLEQSHDTFPSGVFEFEWELTLRLNAALTELESVNLRVLAIRCSEQMSERRRQEVEDALSLFMDSNQGSRYSLTGL